MQQSYHQNYARDFPDIQSPFSFSTIVVSTLLEICLSCAFYVQVFPAAVLISSVHLFIGLLNLRLFSQDLHFNTLDVHPGHVSCLLPLQSILLVISVILVFLLISSFLSNLHPVIFFSQLPACIAEMQAVFCVAHFFLTVSAHWKYAAILHFPFQVHRDLAVLKYKSQFFECSHL